MTKFENIIIKTFAKAGELWLPEIPTITNKLSEHWSLTQIEPIENLTYNFVVKAVQNGKHPVVLKFSCDKLMFESERNALQYFSGRACIKLIDDCQEYNALLLQQAIPGHSLKTLYPKFENDVIDHYAQVIKNLGSTAEKPTQNFKHIRDWLSAIDNANGLSPKLLSEALQKKNRLLASAEQERVLHGDLHQDNVLLNYDECLAIDPKGIIGEVAFEAAAFDFIHPVEIDTTQDIPALFQKRLTRLSEKLNLDPTRLSDWVFVRLVLGACWMLEDNQNPEEFLRLIRVMNRGRTWF